ncbi:uncharacterized protein ASCRUDRAFT_79610 [Ascoidea rubescens DSM 1968]|uniref:Uncharacterized protein n=1 Tax=Ascoidea rubescens DSM 1968 TaxID=1344418 RepID=A0A1D2VN63_9ASCO|nr:hypothetical protein ASCRUDRAFT_79610 [Ascoidea rubescens DSM 1968]ODV63024.1 hypothetical protein ASCRUDRAFT_79610 [Ascoidea rubescens DSM 1968]
MLIVKKWNYLKNLNDNWLLSLPKPLTTIAIVNEKKNQLLNSKFPVILYNTNVGALASIYHHLNSILLQSFLLSTGNLSISVSIGENQLFNSIMNYIIIHSKQIVGIIKSNEKSIWPPSILALKTAALYLNDPKEQNEVYNLSLKIQNHTGIRIL